MKEIKGFQELVIIKLNIKKLVYGAGGDCYKHVYGAGGDCNKVVIAINIKGTMSDYRAGGDCSKHIYGAGGDPNNIKDTMLMKKE